MGTSYWESRGNVHFKGAGSIEEVDWLHAQVFDEAIRLNQILEGNNAQLIRLGIAKTVCDAAINHELATMTINWAVCGHNPSREKIKACTERVTGTVNEGTQFRVGENILERILGSEVPDASTLYVGIANEGRPGPESIWHKVGSRLLAGGETVGLVPYDLYESGTCLSEDQLSEIATMVDTFMSEAVQESLPHLWLDGKFDELLIPGIRETLEI
jgi:hypothetical protein